MPNALQLSWGIALEGEGRSLHVCHNCIAVNFSEHNLHTHRCTAAKFCYRCVMPSVCVRCFACHKSLCSRKHAHPLPSLPPNFFFLCPKFPIILRCVCLPSQFLILLYCVLYFPCNNRNGRSCIGGCVWDQCLACMWDNFNPLFPVLLPRLLYLNLAGHSSLVRTHTMVSS